MHVAWWALCQILLFEEYNIAIVEKIRSFTQAHEVLQRYVPPSRSMSAPYTLERMQKLMTALGNPQNSLKVIHVAGTSGKTSFTTARGTGFWRAGASTADLTGTATGCSGAELLRKKRGKIAADATNNPMAPATRRFRGVALFVLDGGG